MLSSTRMGTLICRCVFIFIWIATIVAINLFYSFALNDNNQTGSSEHHRRRLEGNTSLLGHPFRVVGYSSEHSGEDGWTTANAPGSGAQQVPLAVLQVLQWSTTVAVAHAHRVASTDHAIGDRIDETVHGLAPTLRHNSHVGPLQGIGNGGVT